MDTNNLIKRLKEKDIQNIFKRNRIDSISLIGSYSRGEQKNDSDIDLIFKLNDNAKLTLLKLIKIKGELENKLEKKVDLVEEESINKNYKPYIMNDKKIIF